MKNNNYDEREKLEILKAEHYALNIYLWGTIILIFVQTIMLNDPSNYMYGQLSLTVFVYLFTIIYLGTKGIWSRNIKLSNPKILGIMFLLSVLTGTSGMIKNFSEYHDRLTAVANLISISLFSFIFAFLGIYLINRCVNSFGKRKFDKLQNKED